MHEERNGRPGRRYDDMPQQNQSPVVTDEELIAACKAHDKEEAAQMGEPSPWEVNKDDIDPEWVSSRVAAMRCAMAALPSGVRVKPLEWQPIGPADSDVEAKTELGTYVISVDSVVAGRTHYLWVAGQGEGEEHHSDYTSMREAKAAAQADYERRILSAIDPTPSHAETVAPYVEAPAQAELEVVAWRKRLSDIDGHVTYSNVQIDDDYEPLVRLTDAQAHIAVLTEKVNEGEKLRGQRDAAMAKVEQLTRERDNMEAASKGWWEQSGRWQIRAETAEAKVEELTRELDAAMDRNWVSRPEYERVFALYKTAEARAAEMREALEPFAFLADCSEREPVGASVMVNVERCRDARAALHPEREG